MEGWAISRASSSAGGTCTAVTATVLRKSYQLIDTVEAFQGSAACYLEALELDELLDAVDDEDLVVAVDVPNVAGVEPAVDVDRPRGGLRVVQVPCATPHGRARPSISDRSLVHRTRVTRG